MSTDFNTNKENISSIVPDGKLHAQLVRNVFNVFGYINTLTVLNSELRCTIDVQKIDSEIVDFIMKFKGIKCGLFNNTISYNNYNALDLLSAIYDGVDPRYRNEDLYRKYMDWILSNRKNEFLPVCRFMMVNDSAVIPSKSRMSDVGYDLTAISKLKDINSTTVMLDTGIIVSPQIGYFCKIYPRSSLVKSGYMLANSVGIIDATYRDTLRICLVKTYPNAPEIVFPFKCCQLIFEKQIHMTMEEVDVLESTSRDIGGFGSTDVKK